MGGRVPAGALLSTADFVLLHGNGRGPERVGQMIAEVRASPDYRGQPIIFNEDDHWDFTPGQSNFLVATEAHVSWGYFDFRRPGESFAEGFQSMPADWSPASSDRKRRFFAALAEVTGASP